MFDPTERYLDAQFASDEHRERWAAELADVALMDAAAEQEAKDEAEALAGMGYEDLFTEPCDLSAPEPF